MQSTNYVTSLSLFHILSETTRDESTSTYADNGIAYSCFHLFPLHFSCGPDILKMRRNVLRVKQVVFESWCLN